MKRLITLILISVSVQLFSQKQLYQYVKPIIGTEKMGHTFPGATVPFGAVQLSPETDTLSYVKNGKYNADVYKYCAGYQYTDPTIVGFSHTHFSGTGHSDLGDFLIMPTTGKLFLNPGTVSGNKNGFRSAFSHKTETVEANYYKVKLEDYNITAELTTSKRVGMHQYTFPKSNSSHIILDLIAGNYNYENKNVWTYLRVINDTLVTGYRQTSGWARTRTVYFAMTFSKPFVGYGQKKYDNEEVYKGFWRKFDQTKNFPEMAGRKIRTYFDFNTEEGEKIKIKFALSSVSQENALLNLKTEIPHWDFEKVKKDGQEIWNKELKKIEINALNEDDKVNFYTALYHTFINPTTYTDVNGEYRGLDQNNHFAKGFENYTTFSLWDTYRTLHPLLNLIQPKRNSDMVRSMMAHYDQSALKMLPIWSHYANDNWCMSGYHSVSVIADAIIKGNYEGNSQEALDACITTANHRNYEGIDDYIDNGFVAADKNRTSVSNTLEYAYDDWSIAQLAKKLNKTDVYNTFLKRSENWKNVYDSKIRFMRPKMSDGTFKKEFDVLSTHDQGFIEGNAWNFSLFVPHNPKAMIELMGGKKQFRTRLDSLFTMNLPDKFFAETEDITREGIIGNYVHGNEPSHHVPYLYNYVDAPWKTQETVRMIMKKMYQPTSDGLGGNDDCGQMSAWYIFSALGFYPMSPGSVNYELGSPVVTDASLNLENGNTFKISTKNQGDSNVYVEKVILDGNVLNRTYITHDEIAKGGHLEFIMSKKPKKNHK